MEICQIKKAREALIELKSEIFSEGISIPVEQRESDAEAIDTALACIQSLLDAGEVLPVKKDGEDIMHTGCDLNAEDDCQGCISKGYNARADEDTAILARKMAGLEEVIFNILNSPNFDVMLGHNEKLMKDISKNLALAITEHLKGKR